MKIKNSAKRGVSFLMTLLMVMGLSVTAFAADSSVTFKSDEIIAAAPGSVYTDSDLFDNFKGVMPGDTLSEKITVKNTATDYDYIKVYMRAVLHDEEGNPISENVLKELKADDRKGSKTELEYMYDFLSQLSMTVKNGDDVIYDASPDELDGLAENVYLATLRRDESVKLDVALNVPIEMGNEYSDRIGEVDWVFAVEGFYDPEESEDKVITVRKVWVDDGKDRPDSITVKLIRNGFDYREIELNQDNNWAYTWDSLPDNYRWSVEEADVPEGYEVSYSTRGSVTTITNTKKELPPKPVDPVDPVNPEKIDLTVVKKWDVNGKKHPDSVKVTLFNGETAVETVALGDWNNWTYSWRDLDKNGNWQIIEANVPKGYVPSYVYKDGVVTVTNTESLIETGQLNWPIPVMCALGIALVAYGIIVITKKRKNEEA